MNSQPGEWQGSRGEGEGLQDPQPHLWSHASPHGMDAGAVPFGSAASGGVGDQLWHTTSSFAAPVAAQADQLQGEDIYLANDC